MRSILIAALIPSMVVFAQAPDPGRPVLKRGGPATEHDTREEPPKHPTTGERVPYKVIEVDAEGRAESVVRATPLTPEQELLERARAVADEFTGTLPDFVCDESVIRYEGEGLRPKWKRKDRIDAELAYVDGKEDYRNIRRNGSKIRKGSPEESGQWSIGEFGATLADLMASNTNAKFTPRAKPSEAVGVEARVYDFSVGKDGAHWKIRVGSEVFPAYQGAIWVDPESARVLRIEMDTHQLPANYYVDKVEMAIDYGWVDIAGKRYLLPTRSENLSCKAGTVTCMKNEIEFRNYRKFSAESQVLATDSEITFPTSGDDAKDTKKPDYNPPSLKPGKKFVPEPAPEVPNPGVTHQ